MYTRLFFTTWMLNACFTQFRWQQLISSRFYFGGRGDWRLKRIESDQEWSEKFIEIFLLRKINNFSLSSSVFKWVVVVDLKCNIHLLVSLVLIKIQSCTFFSSHFHFFIISLWEEMKLLVYFIWYVWYLQLIAHSHSTFIFCANLFCFIIPSYT